MQTSTSLQICTILRAKSLSDVTIEQKMRCKHQRHSIYALLHADYNVNVSFCNNADFEVIFQRTNLDISYHETLEGHERISMNQLMQAIIYILSSDRIRHQTTYRITQDQPNLSAQTAMLQCILIKIHQKSSKSHTK